MTANEKFLTQRQRYQPVTLPQDFSDEEMARDWTLSEADKKEVNRYRTNSRLFIAIQLCAVRLYGRFLVEVNDLSPRIVSYLNSQLKLPTSLTINTPDREATFSEQRKNILTFLGFSKLRYREELDRVVIVRDRHSKEAIAMNDQKNGTTTFTGGTGEKMACLPSSIRCRK
jgi:hypothetical protein